ncbi:DNA-directed RNA polymerase subunit B [Candidatus Woesearchaeota archaeon]|nr:DNA-directed RNA polymerase subunit B [Candidatus Woesearchaeota archaeon]
MGDVFLNDVFIGSVPNSKKFVDNFRKMRLKGEIEKVYNVYLNEQLDFIYIDGTPGRIRRPLIAVEKGVSKFTQQVQEKVVAGELSFEDLVQKGIIEYLDAMEEENAYVAFDEFDLTPSHTHLEITPLAMYGFNTGTVPFSNYDEPARLMRGQKTIKQAVGMYALNYQKRKETDRNLLVSPQKPLVETFIYELLGFDKHPAGQNLVVGIMSFEGYNMEDGLILNQSSIERGLQRSFYYKLYSSSETKYPGGLQDKIMYPGKDIKGYRAEEDYRYLEDDGIVYLGQKIATGDVLVGKVSPPRFIEEIEGFGQMINLNVDASLALKEDEKGVVSAVSVIENVDGDKEVNVLLRDHRNPIVGDKFASRHGQKGVVGATFKQSDMPFSENGIVPDAIFSPHSIPGRKTVSHVMEVLAGKVAALSGEFVDANPFDGQSEEELRAQLKSFGFNPSGTEVMFDPSTGKRMEVEIYVGSLYYLRLNHQVDNKIQARGTGPVQLLTRQPAEGRVRGGGLKLGEMEKDALISHGAAMLLKERFSADQTKAMVCTNCGYLADPYIQRYKSKCPICSSSSFETVELAYAFKLFINELRSMGINPSFETKDRFFE